MNRKGHGFLVFYASIGATCAALTDEAKEICQSMAISYCPCFGLDICHISLDHSLQWKANLGKFCTTVETWLAMKYKLNHLGPTRYLI